MLLRDTYCCEGGAGMGYHRAGFEVEGHDLFIDYTQARYPFASHKGDAIEAINTLDADVWHASPPCQRHTAGTRAIDRSGYPDLIGTTREALKETGKPYIIENVKGSPLIDPIELCGCMFGDEGMHATDTDGIELYLQRIRWFEPSDDLRPYLSAPREHDHSRHEWVGGSYGGARRDKYEAKYERAGGYVPSIPVQQKLLGIDWMTQRGMFQSIPPIYTEHLGRQIVAALS